MTKLFGKSDIYSFNFIIEENEKFKAFDFLKITSSKDILAQITNVIRDGKKLIAKCKIIGYRKNMVLKQIKIPISNEDKIEIASDDFIKKTINLKTNDENFFGVLDGYFDIKVGLDIKNLISKHLAVLAKSGAGKSYTVGVILEEILKKDIPILIIDPHSEYNTLRFSNDNEKDISRLKKFGLNPKNFKERINLFSPDTKLNQSSKKVSLDIKDLKPYDLISMFPTKLSPAQQSLILSTLNNLGDKVNFDELIFNIANEENQSKWQVMSAIEQIKKYDLFSENPTKMSDLISYGKCSIISLKGVEPNLSDMFVSQLLKNLFSYRKKELISPFLLVLEEAHNFIPERNLGETKTSKIARTIAAEGRKFGLGMCIITQRPAKIDKNIISQCNTQVILKLTNPSDLKSVISSSEGVDSNSEMEIQNLNIGTCLLTGLIDIPLKINVRPRMSKHGGESVDIKLSYEDKIKYEKKIEEVENQREVISNSKKKFLEFFTIGGFSKNKNYNLIPFLEVKIDYKNKTYNFYVDKKNKKIIYSLNPILGLDLNFEIENFSDSTKKILTKFLELEDNFNPASIMENDEFSYSEIIRVCKNLFEKKILKGDGKNCQINLEYLKNLEKFNIDLDVKLLEINYNEIRKEEITNEDVKKHFENFFKVLNIKEIYFGS